MYAIIVTGGKQYKVEEGKKLKVESLNVDQDDAVEFDEVLLIADGENIQVGTPILEGAKVLAKVVQNGRAKKINIIKLKRRKHHLTHMGHRQYFTEVEITKIQRAAA